MSIWGSGSGTLKKVMWVHRETTGGKDDKFHLPRIVWQFAPAVLPHCWNIFAKMQLSRNQIFIFIQIKLQKPQANCRLPQRENIRMALEARHTLLGGQPPTQWSRARIPPLLNLSWQATGLPLLTSLLLPLSQGQELGTLPVGEGA